VGVSAPRVSTTSRLREPTVDNGDLADGRKAESDWFQCSSRLREKVFALGLGVGG
jgi:hypothetical protein